jgi:hypothetical protein
MSTIDDLKKEFSMWISRAKAFEEKYKEAHQNAESVERVIRLMEGHTAIPPQGITAMPASQMHDKYKNMTMSAAIFDILKTEKNLSMDEIYQRVIDNGFQSNSKTLKRDVATKLSDLKRKGNIGCGEHDKPFRYYLIAERPTRQRRMTT